MSLQGLSSADWLKVAGFAAALAGALVGYGKTQAKVDAIGKEQERQGKMVDAIYQRSLFAESGRSGPEPLLPEK